MLVNIIHPYVFKMQGDCLEIGPVKEHHERDVKLNYFVTAALEAQVSVLHHQYDDGHPISSSMQKAAFDYDPLYSFLQDSRIKTITTLPFGTPPPSVRPDKVSEEAWIELHKIYSSHEEVREKIGTPTTVLFIGGALEACVGGFIQYFDKHYRKPNQRVAYIPDLCVIVNQDFWATQMKSKLDSLNVEAIDYDSALDLVKDFQPNKFSKPNLY